MISVGLEAASPCRELLEALMLTVPHQEHLEAECIEQ